MDEEKLIDALVTRAHEDARRFRESNPRETPSERWIENSYTAALPLVRDSLGAELGPGPHPRLFDAYRRTIADDVGEKPTRGEGGDGLNVPFPGERA